MLSFQIRSLPAVFTTGLFILVFLAACSAAPTASAPTAQITPTRAVSSPTAAQPASAPSPSVAPVQATATLTQPSASAPAATSTAPSCRAPAALTPALTEGPYFKAGSPQRTALLEPGMPGTRLLLTGYVLSVDCKPVAGAKIEFWQADSKGVYDNTGYILRGHQFSDASGRYQLETVVPGLYPGRTEHIHFKIQASNGPVLTSQLFFPGVTSNQTDGIYDPKLLINITSSQGSVQATYNFIINTR